MGTRSDLPLVALVLLACASVLVAPLVGRGGWPGLATALMTLAAAAGVASFGLALRATLRAVARRPGSEAGPDASRHAPSRALVAGASRKEAS